MRRSFLSSPCFGMVAKPFTLSFSRVVDMASHKACAVGCSLVIWLTVQFTQIINLPSRLVFAKLTRLNLPLHVGRHS
jgi:hypothetical protein